MIGTRPWLLSCCALLIPLHASAQEGRCYDSELGPWEPVPTSADVRPMPFPTESGDSLSYEFPPRIRLDPDGMIRVPRGALPSVHRTMTWQVVNDSLSFRLDWRRGYVGVTGGGVPEQDGGWTGTLRSYTHQPGLQRYHRTIRLTPADCATPPPVPASADRDLPTSITFSDGTELGLGSVPPDLADLPPGRTVRSLDPERSVGMLRGASEARFTVLDGEVIELQLTYPPGALERVRARLVESFGPGRAGSGERHGWFNREIEVGLATEVRVWDHRRDIPSIQMCQATHTLPGHDDADMLVFVDGALWEGNSEFPDPETIELAALRCWNPANDAFPAVVGVRAFHGVTSAQVARVQDAVADFTAAHRRFEDRFASRPSTVSDLAEVGLSGLDRFFRPDDEAPWRITASDDPAYACTIGYEGVRLAEPECGQLFAPAVEVLRGLYREGGRPLSPTDSAPGSPP